MSTERNRQKSTKSLSSTKESEAARPTVSFFIVDLEDCDTAQKTIHYIQLTHMIGKPKIVNAEAEKNHKKAVFIFMAYSKTLSHKTSNDPKMLQLKLCQQITKWSEPPKKFLSGFHRTHCMIPSTFCRRQNSNFWGAIESSGRRIAFWTARVDRNASRE